MHGYTNKGYTIARSCLYINITLNYSNIIQYLLANNKPTTPRYTGQGYIQPDYKKS